MQKNFNYEDLKKKENFFTSDQVLSDPVYVADTISMYGYIYYQLTKKEIQWLEFVNNRYSIADYLYNNMIITDQEDLFIVCIDQIELSKIMDLDCQNFGKITCLSDNSALQAIAFYSYMEV